MLQLLNLFTYVAPSGGGTLITPWVQNPGLENQNAALWIDCQLHDGASSVAVSIDSSADTTLFTTITGTNVVAAGQTITALTSNLGPMVRVRASSSSPAAQVVLSVWLIPKDN